MSYYKSSKHPLASGQFAIAWGLAGQESRGSTRSRPRFKDRCSRHLGSPPWRNSRRPPAESTRSPAGSGANVESLRQETEDGYASGGAHVDFSIHHYGRDELVAAEVVAVTGGLIGVVELLGE